VVIFKTISWNQTIPIKRTNVLKMFMAVKGKSILNNQRKARRVNADMPVQMARIFSQIRKWSNFVGICYSRCLVLELFLVWILSFTTQDEVVLPPP
jgi:hypothetical protein